MIEPELVGVPELAVMLGRTQEAIKKAKSRMPYWMPKPIKQGRRIFWRVSDVRAHIQAQAEGKIKEVKQGRPRKEPPTLRVAG